MSRLLQLFFTSLLLSATSSTAQQCELCGCSFCTPGEYPVGNPDALFPIPEGQLTPDIIESLEQLEAAGITLNCAFIATALAYTPPDQCDDLDEFRLLPEIRELCGCPPLPGVPTAAPTAPEPVGLLQWFLSALMEFLDFIWIFN